MEERYRQPAVRCNTTQEELRRNVNLLIA